MTIDDAPQAVDNIAELTIEALRHKEQTASERARSVGLAVRESRLARDGLPIGTKAPDFALPDLEGRTRSLVEFRGRRVLLIFSDTGCGPCQALAPELVHLYRKRRGESREFLMVSRGDPEINRSKAYANGFSFPVLLQRQWEVSRAYAMFATPVGYLIDERGVIAEEVAVGVDAILALAQQGDPAPPLRLGSDWEDGISFVSHGVRIRIRVSDVTIMERLRSILPPGAKPLLTPEVDSVFSLIVGGTDSNSSRAEDHLCFEGERLLIRTADTNAVFDALESRLHSVVAQRAPEHLFVHAGVVGWRGQAIVFPGRSMSGKSTLVAALVQAGATYYSDEFAVFDTAGRVHPFPRPLSLRDPSAQRPERLSAETLGGHAGTEPLPVGLIVHTFYQKGAHWRPRTLSPGRALLTLLENTVQARTRPAVALATLRQVVERALMLEGKRGDVDTMVLRLFKRIEQLPAG